MDYQFTNSDFFIRQLAVNFPIREVDRFIIEVSPTSPNAQVDYELQSKELASTSGSRLFLSVDKFYSEYPVPPANKHRFHPDSIQ